MEKPKLFHNMRPSKSNRDLHGATKEYPTRPEDYQLMETIGRGCTAKVWHAKCIPLDETVAVKILDLERMNVQMEEVIHEAQSMCLYHHPNVLSLYTAFVVEKDLWFVEPFVDAGSVFNIMRYKYPDGLEESVIAIIMKEVAKALEYVHRSGGIHRDVKAGNILIKTDGSVLLADFGVAATIERGGSWGNHKINRNTFVGTPCWMAPEVMEQTAGYDSKADIWSFGITLLELAHGHAPFAKYPPMKVLLMTIQNPPPQLEAEHGKQHFSKHMRDLVQQCLQKDPSKRPSASQILESKFFKGIPDTKYLASHLVGSLPSLAQREKMLELKRDSISEDSAESEAMKTKEQYVRGVSGWDFGDIVEKRRKEMPRQATIEEGKVNGTSKLTEEAMIDETLTDVMDKAAENVSKREQVSSPVQEGMGIVSPTKRNLEQSHGTEPWTKGASHDKNGKHSRFHVYRETKDNASNVRKSKDGSTTEPLIGQETHQPMGKGDDVMNSQDMAEHEHQKPVMIGRFRVSDQVLKKDETKGEKSKASSSASTTSVKQTAVPPATALSSQLQSLLATQRHMSISLECLISAIKEAEKGHPTALQNLLSPSATVPESHEALLQRIKELESENRTLRDRNSHLEQQLENLDWSVANGPVTSHADKS